MRNKTSIVAIVFTALALLVPASAMAGTIEVDVSENGLRFVFDDAPVDAAGFPAYGNSFVTEGYLYPKGTLNGSNGTLPDGSAEFPNLVIGTWTCSGWFVGDGWNTVSGPMVYTSQLFTFDANASSVATNGFEYFDGTTAERAIIGGSLAHKYARGNQSQDLLGMNVSGGVVLRVSLQGYGL